MQHPSAPSTLDAELRIAQSLQAAHKAAAEASAHLRAAREHAAGDALAPMRMLLDSVAGEFISAEIRLGLTWAAAASAARAAAIRDSSAEDRRAAP